MADGTGTLRRGMRHWLIFVGALVLIALPVFFEWPLRLAASGVAIIMGQPKPAPIVQSDAPWMTETGPAVEARAAPLTPPPALPDGAEVAAAQPDPSPAPTPAPDAVAAPGLPGSLTVRTRPDPAPPAKDAEPATAALSATNPAPAAPRADADPDADTAASAAGAVADADTAASSAGAVAETAAAADQTAAVDPPKTESTAASASAPRTARAETGQGRGIAQPDPGPSVDAVALAALGAPSFDLVRVARDGSGLVAGRAAPGARVRVLADGAELGQADVNATGAFVAFIDTSKTQAAKVLTLSAEDPVAGTVTGTETVVILPPDPDAASAPPAILTADPVAETVRVV
ncbi:MAG: hypothetical protein AAF281_01280, partial [Pseudomonadota bacterium]